MGSTTETLKFKSRDDSKAGFTSVKRNISSLDRLASKASRGIAGIAGGAALASLGSLTKKSIDAADAVEKLSRRTGGSAKFLSEMRFALSQNDVSLSDFSNSLRKINKSAQDAADGLSTPSRAFAKLGLNVDNFNKLNTDQKFIKLSQAISTVKDPAIRTQTAMDIMGRSGAQLLTVMTDGAGGIAEYREEAEKMGLSLSQDQVEGAAAANDAIDRLTSSLSGSITQAILPYTDNIVRAADFTREYLPRAVEFLIDVFRGLKVVFNGIVLAIQTGISKLLDAASSIPLIGDDIADVAESFKNAAKETKSSIEKTTEDMGKWRLSSEELRLANSNTTDQIKESLNPAIEESINSFKAARLSSNKASDSAKRLREKKKQEAQSLREANKEMRESERIAREYSEQTGQNLIKTQEELNEILDRSDLKVKNYAIALNNAEKAITSRGLLKGTEEFNQALEDLGFEVENVERKTKSSTKTIENEWSSTSGIIGDVIDNFINDGSISFDGFFDNILSDLGDFLKSFISKWAQSGINSLFSSIFGGSGVGGGGLIESILGGGSGVGSISGLFASGGLFGQGGTVFTAFSKLASLAGPVGIAVAAIGGLVALFSGGRSTEEIVNDETDQLLGQNVAGEALGANGEVGFNGGNAGIFGANFGIQGTGLTSQALGDGGENGNGGFFNGAQRSLEEFRDIAEQAGLQTELFNGTLRVLSEDRSKTTQDIINLWRAYGEGIDQAVSHSEVFATATENNLIRPSNLFFENFATGFAQSPFEARDSLLIIGSQFDSLVQNGMEGTTALFETISDHYGIAVQDAQEFVRLSGVSADQWVANFTSASGQSLAAILDFNAEGLTAFEQLNQGARQAASGVAGQFSGLLNGLQLGTPNAFRFPENSLGQASVERLDDRFLGSFNKGGRFIVPGSGSSDKPFRINLTPGEEVTVKPKGEGRGIAKSSSRDDSQIANEVSSLTKQVSRLIRSMELNKSKEL